MIGRGPNRVFPMVGGLSHRAIHRNPIEPPKLLSASNISKALSLSGLHATRAWGKLYQHCGVSSVLQHPSVTFLPLLLLLKCIIPVFTVTRNCVSLLSLPYPFPSHFPLATIQHLGDTCTSTKKSTGSAPRTGTLFVTAATGL